MEVVSITTAASYDLKQLRGDIIRVLEPIGGISSYVRSGERVLLKPNMLAAKDPDRAVTTHPAIVQIIAELVMEAGGIPLIGDSPGIGGFLRVAEKTGIYAAAQESGATLVEFNEALERSGNGTFRSIRLARAYLEADKVINLPKLKTHEMMTMTCAVKNLFGAVVGVEKAGWHLKAGTSRQLFARMLLEIYLIKKPALNIVDAIQAMEGDGPASGKPIQLGLLIAGVNPVAVDLIAGKLAGIPAGQLPIEREAASLGLPGALFNDIAICGSAIDTLPKVRFKLPKGLDVQFGLPPFIAGALKNHLTSFPAVNKKRCVGCGICRDACPPAAITMQNSAPSIDKARCIRCWCCRELCPYGALRAKSGLLLKALMLLSGGKESRHSSSSEPSGISR